MYKKCNQKTEQARHNNTITHLPTNYLRVHCVYDYHILMNYLIIVI